MHRVTVTSSTTTKGDIGANLLVLLLRFHSSLDDEELGIAIVEGLRISLGGESFHERIELKVETNKDVTYHILIIKPLTGCRHLVGEALHLSVVCSTT
jgi:hypothetical protein